MLWEMKSGTKPSVETVVIRDIQSSRPLMAASLFWALQPPLGPDRRTSISSRQMLLEMKFGAKPSVEPNLIKDIQSSRPPMAVTL
jgi:hypothetical protein